MENEGTQAETSVNMDHLEQMIKDHSPREMRKHITDINVVSRVVSIRHDGVFAEALKVPPLFFGEENGPTYMARVYTPDLSGDAEPADCCAYHVATEGQLMDLLKMNMSGISEMDLASMLAGVRGL